MRPPSRGGTFRQDLYYRLNVYPLALPPLRERGEDIPLLAGHFADRFGMEMGKGRIRFTPEAMEAMLRHPWPGNIRELENCIERLNIIAGGCDITREHVEACFAPGLPGSVPAVVGPEIGPERAASSEASSALPESPDPFPLDLAKRMEDMEREFIVRALAQTGGVQVKAAELLNISERSMWHRIKKLGITIRVTKEIS